MAIKIKSELKSYFQSRDRPTQQNFADLIDSFAHISDIAGAGGSSVIQPIPVDPSITTADIGKLAMLDFDGEIRLYQETPEKIGTIGQWTLTFQSLSSDNNRFFFADISNDVEIFGEDWLDGATTVEEEVTAFIAIINNEFSDAFTATLGSSTDQVVLTQLNPLFIGDELDFAENNVDIQTTIVPIPHIPKAPKRLCLGIIQQVDPINNLAYIDGIYVVHAESAPDIPDVLQQTENSHVIYHIITLIQLIALPANNGKVKKFDMDIFDFDDPTYIFSVIQNAMYIFIKPHTVTGKYYVMRRLLG